MQTITNAMVKQELLYLDNYHCLLKTDNIFEQLARSPRRHGDVKIFIQQRLLRDPFLKRRNACFVFAKQVDGASEGAVRIFLYQFFGFIQYLSALCSANNNSSRYCWAGSRIRYSPCISIPFTLSFHPFPPLLSFSS